MTAHLNTADPLLARILGRSRSIFADDMEDRDSDLNNAISGKRIIVAGAAGSIGLAFVKQILRSRPALLHLIDPDENSLVEAVRDLRSSSLSIPKDFKTFSIGIGGIEFNALIRDQESYDCFINFAEPICCAFVIILKMYSPVFNPETSIELLFPETL